MRSKEEFVSYPSRIALQVIIANSDRRHGLEFDCNQEDCPRCETPQRLKFKLHLAMVGSIDIDPIENSLMQTILW